VVVWTANRGEGISRTYLRDVGPILQCDVVFEVVYEKQ